MTRESADNRVRCIQQADVHPTFAFAEQHPILHETHSVMTPVGFVICLSVINKDAESVDKMGRFVGLGMHCQAFFRATGE